MSDKVETAEEPKKAPAKKGRKAPAKKKATPAPAAPAEPKAYHATGDRARVLEALSSVPQRVKDIAAGLEMKRHAVQAKLAALFRKGLVVHHPPEGWSLAGPAPAKKRAAKKAKKARPAAEPVPV